MLYTIFSNPHLALPMIAAAEHGRTFYVWYFRPITRPGNHYEYHKASPNDLFVVCGWPVCVNLCVIHLAYFRSLYLRLVHRTTTFFCSGLVDKGSTKH